VLLYSESTSDTVLGLLMELAEDVGRYAAFAGLDARRRSFSFSNSVFVALTGEGVSSIISTHPDESLTPLVPFFFSFDLFEEILSKLDLGLTTSSIGLGMVGDLMKLGRPLVLPMRSLGTRVCSFCSRFLTRARISDTICTPLFREGAGIGMLVGGLTASACRGAVGGGNLDGRVIAGSSNSRSCRSGGGGVDRRLSSECNDVV
jgi:hypothetical protein